ERLDRRVAEEEIELPPVLGTVDVARAVAVAGLDEQRVAGRLGHVAREPARRRRDAVLLEEVVRLVLVRRLDDDLGVREEQRRAELVTALCELNRVDVGQRDDK